MDERHLGRVAQRTATDEMSGGLWGERGAARRKTAGQLQQREAKCGMETFQWYTFQWCTFQWYTFQWYTFQWCMFQWYTFQWYTFQWYTFQWNW